MKDFEECNSEEIKRLNELIVQHSREIEEYKVLLNDANLKILAIGKDHDTTIAGLKNNNALLIDQIKDENSKLLLNL